MAPGKADQQRFIVNVAATLARVNRHKVLGCWLDIDFLPSQPIWQQGNVLRIKLNL